MWQYLYPGDEELNNLFTFMDEIFMNDILLLGHTHFPFVLKNDKKEIKKDLMIINPGSVGLPRDGDQRASYAVLDVKKMDAKIERVEYDVQKVVDKIYELGWPKYYAERLLEGK